MHYQYSVVLEPSAVEIDGLCDGLSVRKHANEDLEEIGTFCAQKDWRSTVKPMSKYTGGLGPIHNFMAVALPECLPDRFEIVSYANEFAFLHDDATETLDEDENNTQNDEMLVAFQEGARLGRITTSESGKRRMQAKILETMIEIDRPRALTAIRAWAAFVEQGSGREHHVRFDTLDEYLPYRCRDVGQKFWHALLTFGCAITIPDTELSEGEELVLPAVIAQGLTNDLYSYDKEYDAAQEAGLPDVVNALWVLMHVHRISLEEAKVMCRDRIKSEVSAYVDILAETAKRTDLSEDAKRYVDLMQFSVSGNLVWSLHCPRYHTNIQFNKRQLFREKLSMTQLSSKYQVDNKRKRCHSESTSSGDGDLPRNITKKTKDSTASDFFDEGSCQSISSIDDDNTRPSTTNDSKANVQDKGCESGMII